MEGISISEDETEMEAVAVSEPVPVNWTLYAGSTGSSELMVSIAFFAPTDAGLNPTTTLQELPADNVEQFVDLLKSLLPANATEVMFSGLLPPFEMEISDSTSIPVFCVPKSMESRSTPILTGLPC